ncbi:unnamed protein product [Victoria cruziana]
MAAPTASMNIMLAIHEKRTSSVDLYRPIRQYISYHYSERQAQDMEEDLQTLREMRNEVEKAVDSLEARRDFLQRYFRALCAVESRFPISTEREHVNTITFTWYDTFKQNKKASQQNVHFEKAAVLFNLAAIHSQIALSADRTTPLGLKQACNSFQAAAGVFAFLRDNVAMKASLGPSTVDISVECAGMLERLMLAQAQECFFEKVIADGKPPGLCAKVSRQLKAAQFNSEACYRFGMELHEKEEIAEEIARLKVGIALIADAKKSAKGAAASLLDAINRIETNLNRNLERAAKENDRVYLMRIPPSSSLAPLPAASLVKPTPMDDIFDASKERMFAALVPDSSAKALSRYTEMVDDIIRTQAEKLQQGSEITRVKLKEMELPDSILSLEGNFSLPLDLKEDVEAVQISGGPRGLETELQQLRDLRRVNQEMLVQTEELLQKEAREDAQFRSQFGTRWTRPQSSTLTKNLSDRLNRFAGNLKQAGESDARIERAVRDHSALMAILDCKPIESALPNLARPIMSLDSNEDAIVGELKQSLRQLENLGSQRAGLEDMLKDMKRKDDILPKLMARAGSYEDLFKKELGKYDSICQEIAQNIEAQEQLLLQIQAQNENFAAVFNLEDYKAAREKSYKQIAAAVAKYQEIKENINEGLKFYVTLQDAIKIVKQQCSDYVMTRNIQCQEMVEDVQRQVAGLKFTDEKTGYAYPSAGQPNQRGAQQLDPQSAPHPSYPQPPYYRSGDQSTAGYMSSPAPPQAHPSYPSHQTPYHMQQPSGPYQQPPQTVQQPNLEYGQPAYSGWRGPPYYNPHSQPAAAPPATSGVHPPPPYQIPPYPPQQGGPYYNRQ